MALARQKEQLKDSCGTAHGALQRLSACMLDTKPDLALAQTLRSRRRSASGLPSVATIRRQRRSAAKATAGLPPLPISSTRLPVQLSVHQRLPCGYRGPT